MARARNVVAQVVGFVPSISRRLCTSSNVKAWRVQLVGASVGITLSSQTSKAAGSAYAVKPCAKSSHAVRRTVRSCDSCRTPPGKHEQLRLLQLTTSAHATIATGSWSHLPHHDIVLSASRRRKVITGSFQVPIFNLSTTSVQTSPTHPHILTLGLRVFSVDRSAWLQIETRLES